MFEVDVLCACWLHVLVALHAFDMDSVVHPSSG